MYISITHHILHYVFNIKKSFLLSSLEVKTFPLNHLFSVLQEFSSFYLFIFFLQIIASIPRAFCIYLCQVLSISLSFYFSPKKVRDKKKVMSWSHKCLRPSCLWKFEDQEDLKTVGQYALI